MDIRQGVGFGYLDEETKLICMIKCFKCARENYGPYVSSGCCAFCGYNAGMLKISKSKKRTKK